MIRFRLAYFCIDEFLDFWLLVPLHFFTHQREPGFTDDFSGGFDLVVRKPMVTKTEPNSPRPICEKSPTFAVRVVKVDGWLATSGVVTDRVFGFPLRQTSHIISLYLLRRG
jgi:hypothetical protein